MIIGYFIVVDEDSPYTNFSAFTDFYRKTAMILTESSCEFFISVEGTEYSFKVLENIRKLDRDYVSSGLGRIGFIQPNLDILIFCNPGELKEFLYTMEVFQSLKKPLWRRIIRSVCVYKPFWKPISCDFPVYNISGVSRLKRWILYKWCYGFEDCQLGIHKITMTSYPFLTRLTAISHNLVEFPKALGSLPCLSYLNLSANLLVQATNWNWLTSPFIRANLRELYLDGNGLFRLPEAIRELKNLETFSLNMNCFTELPTALESLKCLSVLHIGDNKLENLPAWMYRKKHFSLLGIGGNNFNHAVNNSAPRISPEEFRTVTVPCLLEIVAKFIITKRLAFREYNIPATLAYYLEEAYYCRCGSVVFRDMTGQVVECLIPTETLAHDCDDEIVSIVIRCCSYKCYKLIEPYMILVAT